MNLGVARSPTFEPSARSNDMAATTTSTTSNSDPSTAPRSRASGRIWAGRVLSGLPSLFLVWDAAMKLMAHPQVVEGSVQLGYPPSTMFGIGLVLLLSVVVYLIPRTAPLGAVLLTGYLGGAIATHVRVEHPLFSHTLFPVYVAAFVWGGLYLRDARVRQLLGRVHGAR